MSEHNSKKWGIKWKSLYWTVRFETPSESYVPRGLAVGLIPSSWDLLLLAISSVLEKILKSTGSQCPPMNRPSQATLQWRMQVGSPQHTHIDSNNSCGSFLWDKQGQPREQVKHKKQNLKQKYQGSRKLQKVNHQYPQKSEKILHLWIKGRMLF